MENASKALLIAAAILIAILIISIGIYVVNRTNKITNMAEGELSITEIQIFNSKYELHEGICYGSTVRKLLSYAIQDNEELLGKTQKEGSTIDLCINIRSNHPEIIKAFSNKPSMLDGLTTRSYGVRYAENIRQISRVVNPQKKYKVWFSYTAKNGHIWEIHIDSPE